MEDDKSSNGHCLERNYNYNCQAPSDCNDLYPSGSNSHESISPPKRMSIKIKQQQDHEMMTSEEQPSTEMKESTTKYFKHEDDDDDDDSRNKENVMTDSFGRHRHHKRAMSSPRSHSHNFKLRNKNRSCIKNHNDRNHRHNHDPYIPRNHNYMDNHYYFHGKYCQPFPPIPPPYFRERRFHYEYDCHRYHHYPEEERGRRSYPPRYYHPPPPRNFSRCSSPPRPYHRSRVYRRHNNKRAHWPNFRTSYRGERSRYFSQDGRKRESTSNKDHKIHYISPSSCNDEHNNVALDRNQISGEKNISK